MPPEIAVYIIIIIIIIIIELTIVRTVGTRQKKQTRLIYFSSSCTYVERLWQK
jgi:hypothetical protein